MQAKVLQPAFLLHAWPYKESSMLADFFTRDNGRISAIIRGAKRKNSVVARLVNPFIALSICWQGKGQLHTMTHIEGRGTIGQLTARRLISGLYVNELIVRLCKHADPHPQIFDDYEQTLRELAKVTDEQPALRFFEKNLLQEIGYELPLIKNIITGEVVAEDKYYHFDPTQGPCAAKVELSSEGLVNIMQPFGANLTTANLFKGDSLLALEQNIYTCNQHSLDAKRLMRQVLAIHLGDRPLATRKLFMKV